MAVFKIAGWKILDLSLTTWINMFLWVTVIPSAISLFLQYCRSSLPNATRVMQCLNASALSGAEISRWVFACTTITFVTCTTLAVTTAILGFPWAKKVRQEVTAGTEKNAQFPVSPIRVNAKNRAQS